MNREGPLRNWGSLRKLGGRKNRFDGAKPGNPNRDSRAEPSPLHFYSDPQFTSAGDLTRLERTPQFPRPSPVLSSAKVTFRQTNLMREA